ncbi:hypothetical protein [uncultured Duncaniella sp.]|uniref:hypothetical protein n=1 Tax=uncultured Duncaniella sp. TaxID=2768039 RepID=UPI0025FCD502|nr:hypothetical protein [uncultured Duncaniella sp.]
MSRGCGCERGVLRYIKPPYARLFYPACCIHDDDYDRGGDNETRKTADRRLFRNCMKIATGLQFSPWKSTWLTLIALLYYVSVRIFGRFYFHAV